MFKHLEPIAEAHAGGQTVQHKADDDVAGDEADVLDHEEHWINDPATRKKFWRWVKDDMQLTEEEAHEALGVEHVEEFAESKAQAMAVIKAYAAAKHTGQNEGMSEREQEYLDRADLFDQTAPQP